jgi:hypothetical protein
MLQQQAATQLRWVSPSAATIIGSSVERSARSQPLIDHGAPPASSGESLASGFDSPMPPARKLSGASGDDGVV